MIIIVTSIDLVGYLFTIYEIIVRNFLTWKHIKDYFITFSGLLYSDRMDLLFTIYQIVKAKLLPSNAHPIEITAYI